MKQILFVVVCICCTLCSCSSGGKNPITLGKTAIVDCYVNDFGYKVFVMSDGGMTEVITPNEDCRKCLRFYDREHHLFHSTWEAPGRPQEAEENMHRWFNAEIGDSVILERKEVADIFDGEEYLYSYNIKFAPDYTTQRKIARITKYDGNLNKWDGAIKLYGGFLTSTSGKGQVNEEGMASENMFINIYFEERAPICVNAQENQLWLDVEAGDTIIEKRINGKLLFSPQF